MAEENPTKSKSWCGHAIDHSIRRFFYKLGKMNATHPKKVIAISLFICLASASGMFFLVSESLPEKIWVPQNSEAQLDKKYVDQHYAIDPRVEDFIAFSKDRKSNIITSSRLSKLAEIVNALTDLKDENGQTYPDFCLLNGKGKCFVSSILSVWSFNQTLISSKSDAQLLADINFALTLKVLTRNDLNSLLGNASFDSANKLISATGTRHNWYLDGEKKEELWLPWELAWFAKVTKEIGNLGSSGMDGTAAFSRTVQFELQAGISDNIPYMVAAFLLIITYASISLGKRDRVQSKTVLANMGVLAVALSIGMAFGLAGYMGLFFSTPNSVIPFLVLGIGVDDMFIIVDTFERTKRDMPIKKRIAQGLSEAGASITMTSVTDFLAFLIGTLTTLPAMQSFCVYAAMSVLFDYCMQVTFFVACMSLDAERRSKNRLDCCCWIERHTDIEMQKRPKGMSRSASTHSSGAGTVATNATDLDDYGNPLPHTPFARWLQGSYMPFLLHPVVKVFILLFFAALLAFNIWSAIQLEQNFYVKDLAQDGSYLIKYEDETNWMWDHLPTRVHIFTKREVDFTADLTITRLDEMRSRASDSTKNRYVERVGDWWYQSFIEWYNTTAPSASKSAQGLPSTKTAFFDSLHVFLKSSGSQFADDIVFISGSNKTAIESTRLPIYLKAADNTTESVNAMIQSRKIVSDTKDIGSKMFCYGYWFIFSSQFAVIELEAYQNLILAGVAVVIACSFFLLNPGASFFIFLMVGSIDMGLLSVMHWWGLSIDSVSVAIIVLSTGFSADLSGHITHQFLSLPGPRKERITVAMGEMGASVLNGAMSTFLGVAFLGVAPSNIFRTFFKMLFGTITLGTIHGFILLPILLSLFGPEPVLEHHLEQPDELDDDQDDKVVKPSNTPIKVVDNVEIVNGNGTVEQQ